MKGAWWMPWHEQAMKDVISCDKPRGAANKLGSADFRMGQPGTEKQCHPLAEHIGLRKLTRRTETSKYPEEEKTIVIPQVVASERGIAQTGVVSAASGL